MLLSSSQDLTYTPVIHLLHVHLTTLARYDPSWPIRDLTRFFVSLVSKAGVKTENAEERLESLVQDAFARGELVDLETHVQDGQGEGKDETDADVQETLKEVLFTGKHSSNAVQGSYPFSRDTLHKLTWLVRQIQ